MLKALKGKLIIKREDGDEKTEGGIYVPDIARKKKNIGVVVSVGAGSLQEDLSNGDRIYFDGAVDKFEYKGEWFHCIKYEDVVGIVT